MTNGGEGSDDDIVETNNKQSDGYFSLEWFQGYNGFDQAVLDEFSSITGLKKLKSLVLRLVQASSSIVQQTILITL